MTKCRLASAPGKDPLAEITVALFGNDSFVDIQQNSTDPIPDRFTDWGLCAPVPPLANLVDDAYSSSCTRVIAYMDSIADWLEMLTDEDGMTQRLTNAAILANTLHLSDHSAYDGFGTLDVDYDLGLFFPKTINVASKYDCHFFPSGSVYIFSLSTSLVRLSPA